MQATLDALGFLPGEIFQLVAIGPGGKIRAQSFTDEESGWLWIRDDEVDNYYIVGNPLKAHKRSKAKDEDIAVTRVLLLDADPEKTDEDPDGFSDVSRAACLDFTQRVNEWMFGICGMRMPVCDSGRGYQMWIRTGVTDRRSFLRRLALTFGQPGVTVDATQDASRLLRLPGTVNTKTGRVACLMPS